MTGDKDFDEILTECIKILGVKGKDYTIGSDDRLANFNKVAEFTGQTPEAVLGTYLYKHVSAVFSYIKTGGQSESEPIKGRIADVINYMLLFYKMVQEKKVPVTTRVAPVLSKCPLLSGCTRPYGHHGYCSPQSMIATSSVQSIPSQL